MAISYIATGITAGADTATPFANISYTLPASTQTGDLLIAFYGGKPYNTVPSTPTDYTARSGGANGTTAMGSGAGSVYAVAFTKAHDGSESNPVSTFSAQYSPGIGAMLAVRDSVIGANSVWSIASCKGSDATSTDTTYSATGDATLGYTVGDIVVALLVHNDDSSSSSSFGLSIPGCTLQNVTQRLTGTLTTGGGNDGRMYVVTAEVATGTASGAPVATATTGSGDSDGQSVFLLVRQTSVKATGSLTLGGSRGASVVAAASGTLTLGATPGPASAALTAAGSITLGGDATATTPVAVTASGSLELSGSAGWFAPPAVGSIRLGGSAWALVPIIGSLTLTGRVDVHPPASMAHRETATAGMGGASTATATITGSTSTTATIERS